MCMCSTAFVATGGQISAAPFPMPLHKETDQKKGSQGLHDPEASKTNQTYRYWSFFFGNIYE
jgi:hypothetical protein